MAHACASVRSSGMFTVGGKRLNLAALEITKDKFEISAAILTNPHNPCLRCQSCPSLCLRLKNNLRTEYQLTHALILSRSQGQTHINRPRCTAFPYYRWPIRIPLVTELWLATDHSPSALIMERHRIIERMRCVPMARCFPVICLVIGGVKVG